MATGDRRMGFSARRGMTVLGKIPAVPKPINLPSQRLENRGLDPSVEIVPRGTFSWATGRSPPTGGSSWGNVGLASSPPLSTGAWNTASNAQAASNPGSSGGGLVQDPPRPLSAGSTPSSSAPTTTRRAWGAAAKLEEQLKPSRFTLTSVDFPTLGSDKNPNPRSQQNTTALNWPTSADGRHSVYPEESSNRPTSADGTKERQLGYPGIVPSNRPTSADGTFVDKERHPVYSETSPSNRPASADGRHWAYSDIASSNHPPSADGSLVDKQRHPVYMGGVGHGTAGPGLGIYGRLEDNYNLYPSLVRQGIRPPGSHGIPIGPGMYPGSSHHDGYHRSQVPHYGNMEDRETIMLAVGGSPRVYGSYPLHSGSPDLFNRSGVYGRYHPQSVSPEHPGHGTVGIGLQSHGMDIMLSHERPVLGHGRDGYHGIHQEFGEQRGGWAGRDRVHLSMPIDASDNRSPTSIHRTGVELRNSNTSITSWGHHPRHGAWGSISSGDTPMGIYEADASSSILRPATLLEKIPQGIMLEGELKNRYMDEIEGGAGHAGEAKNSLAARRTGDGNKGVLKNEKQPESHLDMVNSKENHVAGKDAASAAESIDSLGKDMPYQKQEDMPFPAENLTRKEVLVDSESSEKGRNGWVGRSPRGGGGDRQPPSSVSVIESGADQPKQATIIIVGRYQLEQDNQGAVSGVNETKDFSRPVPEIAVSPPAVGFAQLLSKSAEVQVPGAEVCSHQEQSSYQTPKALEEVGGRRAENSEELPKMVPAAKVAIQTVKESPRGDKKDAKFSKANNDIQIADDDSKSRFLDAAKSTNVRRKMPMSCKSTRGTKKDGLPLSLLSERKGATGVSEESLLSSQTSERHRVNGSTSSCAGSSVFSGEKPNGAVLSAVKVTCDATHACSESGKKVYTDAYSNSVSDAHQVESLKHTEIKVSFRDENEGPLKPIDDFVVKACETLSVPSSKEEVQVCNDDGPNKKTKRKAHSLKRFQRDHSLHELHTMDKQHANDGMVWAPVNTSATVGGIKEETQLCISKPHTLEQMQQISAESSHQRYAQPMQQQLLPTESRNQQHAQQVQQLQSAETSHQGQGQQMQQQSAISSKKKQGQQMQEHQPAENSHKKQGQHQSGASIDDQQIQRQSAASSRNKEVKPQQSGASVHQEHQQWMQQEQSTAMSFKKQGQETQQKHSVSSSHQEQGQQMRRQFTASSPEVQREVQMKMCPPEDQEEKAGQSLTAPVGDKSEPRKNKDGTAIYIPKPARQQQLQGQQQQSAASSDQGQRHVHKGERSFSEDQGTQPFGTSAMPAFIGPESNKNKGERKSYNSKYSRQQAMHQQASLASCNAGERHVHTRERSLPEETGEKSLRTSATPLIAVSEANKDKEETNSHNPKYVIQQEVQQQQSAAGNHQEHRYGHTRERSLLEEHWKQPTQTPEIPVVLGFESSKSKDETKFYIPKHARQQHMHQQQAVTSSHQGQKQAYRGREAHLSDEELEQSAQSSASPVGEPAKKKDEIELYTSKPARQQQIQQQSTARSHHGGQRKARERPLAQEQYQPAVWTSATQVGTGSESTSKNKDMARHDGHSDSKGNKDAIRSCAAGSKDDSNSCVSSESNKNKKEIKYYVPKPGRQPQLQRLQSVPFIDQGQKQVSIRERPTPQAAAPIVTGSESSKREDKIKLYTPKPVRKQQTQSATGGHKEERETQTGELSLLEEQWEQQKVGNDGSARESGQFSRYRNHPSNPCKSTSSPRVPIKSQPPLVEDGPIDDSIPRASETNGRGLIKEHIKESSSRDPGYHQKNKSSKWQHDVTSHVAEKPHVAEARLSKQKQHIHVTKSAGSLFDSVRNGSLISTKFNSTPADNQKRRYHYQPVAQSSQTFKPREQEFEVGYEGDTRQLDQGQNKHERHDNGPSRHGWFHGYSYRHAHQEG